MQLDIVTELGLVIISCGIMGVISYFLKQPLVFAYVVAGIIIGPYGFGFIQDTSFIDGIAKVGIALLLFLIGMEMNISKLKELGKVAVIAGVGQVLFTGLIGFGIISFFDFPMIQKVYLAIALVFSSTVVAVKLMSDKRDTHSLYGQICIGILIVQDVLAIIALLVLSGFATGEFQVMSLVQSLGTGIIVAIVSSFISSKFLTKLYSKIATSHELLILFSITWCFIVALTCYQLGFSKEIGAFIAGLNLANLPYTYEINSKAKVLRDFFITIFFAGLGAGLVFGDISAYIAPIIILSLFVLIGNPIIVMSIMGAMGYDKRTSFFTGLNIANISEFSLIVVTLGRSLGHVSDSLYSAIGIIALVTMVTSSYMITYNNFLYSKLKHKLKFFEFKKSNISQTKQKTLANHIIIMGVGQIGEQILEQVLSFKEDYIAVDNDNNVIKELINNDINCMFGDVSDEEVLQELDIKDAEILICTLPSIEVNHIILKELKEIPNSSRPFVIMVSNSAREGMELFVKGADYVIVKPYLSASKVHDINKHLYDLPDHHHHKKTITRNKTAKAMKDEHKSDKEIAFVLNKLNNMRLQEMKNKISGQDMQFLKNVS